VPGPAAPDRDAVFSVFFGRHRDMSEDKMVILQFRPTRQSLQTAPI
jgi:hypothetical protein